MMWGAALRKVVIWLECFHNELGEALEHVVDKITDLKEKGMKLKLEKMSSKKLCFYCGLIVVTVYFST